MLNKNPLFIRFPLIFLFLLLAACGEENVVENSPQQEDQTVSADVEKVKESEKIEPQVEVKVKKISWDELIPSDYNPNKIIDKYLEQMEQLQDDDPKAAMLYGNIQAELDNAPVNMELDGKTIKMPGFIAPLENNNGVINEFLLVPYFGACIHTPPPPVNQTVMVKVNQGKGVKSDDANFPVWITGKLIAVEERTTIGAAGYRIENAVIEPYEED